MKKDSLLEILRKHSFTNTLILDIWPPELGENKFGVFFMHLPCGTFLGHSYEINTGFPSGSDGTQSNVGDLDSIPGSGRSPGEVNGNPYSILFILVFLPGEFHGQRNLEGDSPYGGHKVRRD